MKGVRKPFDQELFNDNDNIGRVVVKAYLSQSFQSIFTDNPDKYGPDLVSGSFFIEVEHSRIWDGVHQPHSTFHILGRKEECLKKSVAYCIVSSDLSKIAICPKSTLVKYMTNDHLHEYRNSMVSKGEMMWFVPHSEIKYVDAPPEFHQEFLRKGREAMKRAYQLFQEMFRKNDVSQK